MTTLVLTVVGDDRAGLVATVAEIVGAHGGNWETSALAELSGAFAGIIEVSVPATRADELREALSVLEGLLSVAVHAGGVSSGRDETGRRISLTVLGNDRTGIVHEISSALGAQGVSIERMSTETRDAAMAGGRLFEATVIARVPAGVDVADVAARIERLADDLQVDVALED